MPRQRLTTWLLCLLTFASGSAVAGDWKMAETPHYRLVTQASDREATQWMRDFDQFILSTAALLKIDSRSLPPLTVVIFDRDKNYTPYKVLRPNGQVASVAGQFIRMPTWSVIGMPLEGEKALTRSTIFHEATHWLASVDESRQPAWFSEGIAEMFSTFDRRGDNVSWARPLAEHLALLQWGTLPLREFLVEPSAIFDRDGRTEKFYAQAWAFTHFMTLAEDSRRRPLMIRFLQNFRTLSGEAAMQATFGDALPELERDFGRYLSQRSFGYITQPVQQAAPPPALRPAPPAVVEAALGRLALGSGRFDVAKRHATRLDELDPRAPQGQEILAYLALDQDQEAEAVLHAEEALHRGSKDSGMYLLMGDSYLRGDNAGRPNAELARVNLYENAINLAPLRRASYEKLADALLMLDNPREEDLRFLNTGLKVFPGEDWLRVAVAAVERQLGRPEAAAASLERALSADSTLDEQQREHASHLKRGWIIDSMNTELQAATSARDPDAVLAIVQKYRPRVDDVPEAMAFLDDMEARMNQMKARQAAGGRK